MGMWWQRGTWRIIRGAAGFAALALLGLAGCGSAQNAASAVPSVAPPTISATPTPSRDPACDGEKLRTFFDEVQQEYERGAFDMNRKVRITSEHIGGWPLALGDAKYDAGFQLHKSLTSLDDAIKDLFVEGRDSDAFTRQVQAATLRITASTVLLECRLSDEYTFDD